MTAILIIVGVAIALFPFYYYILSQVQMIGWIKILREEYKKGGHKHGKKKQFRRKSSK